MQPRALPIKVQGSGLCSQGSVLRQSSFREGKEEVESPPYTCQQQLGAGCLWGPAAVPEESLATQRPAGYGRP